MTPTLPDVELRGSPAGHRTLACASEPSAEPAAGSVVIRYDEAWLVSGAT